MDVSTVFVTWLSFCSIF